MGTQVNMACNFRVSACGSKVRDLIDLEVNHARLWDSPFPSSENSNSFILPKMIGMSWSH